MTFEEAVKDKLVNNGLFPNQAEAIFQAVRDDPANSEMSSRWLDNTEDYPAAILAVIWLSVCDHTLAWIDTACPKAWFRSLFV
jgi:Arc/MetJ-type ribon-helix-helix transcriptional regulator